MALTYLGEKRVGSASVRKQGNSLIYEEQYHLLYQADADHSREYVRDNSLVPQIGQVFVTISSVLVCKAVEIERDAQNKRLWRIGCTLSTEVEEDSTGANNSNQGQDPTTWVPIAELGFETYTDYWLRDKNGDPHVNSAGLAFASGLPSVRTLTRFDFAQFEPDTLTDEDIAERNETINSADFKGKAAKTLKLTVRKATLGYYYGTRCWRIDYSIVYKKDNWQVRRLDTGPFYIDGADEVPFTDRDGNRYIGNLDGSGGASSGDPSILTFDTYDELDFGSFIRT